MWAIHQKEPIRESGLRFTVDLDSRPATVADVLAGWENDRGFRSLFNSSLARAPYRAFRWETPGVDWQTVGRPFEFVILDSPGLAPQADPAAFAEQLRKEEDLVAVFSNLGGDAILVVPKPLDETSACAHLAAFVRGASQRQQDALWQAVGKAMLKRIGSRPVWLSTAGAAVPWLHVRLDDWPKYYGYGPYRLNPQGA